jgi:hypothetical protein
MLITKEQIIEAIRTEPLAPGYWVTGPDGGPPDVGATEHCAVCAVGALLRGCTDLRPREAQDLAYDITSGGPITGGNPEHLLSTGRPLNALSCLFEASTRDLAGENTSCLPLETRLALGAGVRGTIVAFVKRPDFPTVIEIPDLAIAEVREALRP